MKSRVYKNGLPFLSPLDKSVDSLKLRIDNKKASMVIIDGGVGEGKTTLGVEIAEYYQRGPIDLKRQYAMGGEQFQEKLVMCYEDNLLVIIYDEAGDFNTRGSLTRFNQMLNRVFETYRAFRILVIIILPDFSILDKSLFDKRIPRLLLHCHGRTNKYGNYSAYSIYRMFYIKKKMKQFTVPAFAYSSTTPNFRGHFLDLSPERSKKLEEISVSGKINIVNENILKNRGLLSYKQIAGQLGRSVVWAKKKVQHLKLKPDKIYKKAAYFDKDIIKKLEDELGS